MQGEIQIDKVKVKEEKIEISYKKTAQDGAQDEYAFRCHDKALPSFYDAMEILALDVCKICELPENYVEGMKVSGVSYSWTNGIMGAVITAQKSLLKSNAPLIINTPNKASAVVEFRRRIWDFGNSDSPGPGPTAR